MKRMVSRKSHSWWWDSHISPKNSKWLAENLDEMDRNVKQMLRLIEEDGDSFAKKAEMYYQKRPELISHVEVFNRMYRSLAERYDHVTGELRKNIPSDLQAQNSGISDISSGPVSAWPSPDQRTRDQKPGHRAAGFDFFLGSGGSSSNLNKKEGDESSSLSDTDTESDTFSVNNCFALPTADGNQGLQKKIIELEGELRHSKQKLLTEKEERENRSFGEIDNRKSENSLAKTRGSEETPRSVNGTAHSSVEEFAGSQSDICDLIVRENNIQDSFTPVENGRETLESQEEENAARLGAGGASLDCKIQRLKEELRIMKERLQVSEKEIVSLRLELESNRSQEVTSQLQSQLGVAQREIVMCKTKLEREKREVSKLQERVARYKTSLSDRDQELRELKVAVADAEQKFSLAKLQLQSEISKLLEERRGLEAELINWESQGACREEDVRRLVVTKKMMETFYQAMEKKLKDEIEMLKADIAEKDVQIEGLSRSFDAFESRFGALSSERDELNAKVVTLAAEVNSRDESIDQMDKILQQLHWERLELIALNEGARQQVEKLQTRIKELENEVERHIIMISEAAEEKREAIRQLCFSLEHYRDGYHRLLQAFSGHKRLPVLAS
ncbi:Protein Networked (NET), actin-binding (NAB) domain [Dillenia turbinata]|uniref:Protein Networked (NET), actin-binding (NAB) domain n=1 Tax=Dillenia turbinata TaxID=194707 RepID=A0AAN8Z9E4_9MAGN